MQLISIRSLVVILLAALCGLFASFGMNLLLKVRSDAPVAAPSGDTVPVVVLRAGVPRGQRVKADALEVAQWPKNLVPSGIFSSIEDAVERVALQSLVSGELLLVKKLSERGASGGMASLIPSGMRAYSIATQRVPSNVSGLVLPGNLVDVLLTLRSNQQDETGGGSTTTLLQAVEVLAVDRDIERDMDPSPPATTTAAAKPVMREATSVTLLVTPDQAARLDLGQTLGNLSLSLRNPDDRVEASAMPATVTSIRFSQDSPDFNSVDEKTKEVAPPVEPEVEMPPPPRRFPSSVFLLRGQTWNVVRVHGGAN